MTNEFIQSWTAHEKLRRRSLNNLNMILKQGLGGIVRSIRARSKPRKYLSEFLYGDSAWMVTNSPITFFIRLKWASMIRDYMGWILNIPTPFQIFCTLISLFKKILKLYDSPYLMYLVLYYLLRLLNRTQKQELVHRMQKTFLSLKKEWHNWLHLYARYPSIYSSFICLV